MFTRYVENVFTSHSLPAFCKLRFAIGWGFNDVRFVFRPPEIKSNKTISDIVTLPPLTCPEAKRINHATTIFPSRTDT